MLFAESVNPVPEADEHGPRICSLALLFAFAVFAIHIRGPAI